MPNTPTKAEILKAAAIERMIAATDVHDTYEVRCHAERRAYALERIAKDMPDD